MSDARSGASMPEDARRGRQRCVAQALALTGTFFLVRGDRGLGSRSLALLANAAHLFTDVMALILTYAAMTLRSAGPRDRKEVA